MTDDLSPGLQPPGTPEAAVRGSALSGRVIAVAILVAVVAAAVLGRAWLDTGASRTLPGTPLTIQTAASAAPTCAPGLIPPSRLVVRDGALVLVAADGGADIPVEWPAGYAGRLDQGHGELYDASGYLVAVAGETVQERYFGAPGPDGAFHVCRVAGD